jgi:hypothetical protein
MADMIAAPGAHTFTGLPEFENDALASVFVVAPTVMTLS